MTDLRNVPPASADAVAPSRPVLVLVSSSPAPEPPPSPPAPTALPSLPFHPAIYAGTALLLGITQGLGINLLTANLTGLQASFGATQTEVGWLSAAYFATNMTGTLVLFKVRTQFGLRRFAEIGILIYVAVVVAHLFTNDLRSALLVRAMMGIAAAPLSTLAFFYMLEWLPPARKMSIGLCFGLLGSGLAVPIARVISPELLQIGEWHGLYLLEAGLALVSLAAIFLVPITQPPRAQVFDRDDLISFPLLGIGLGCLAVVASMGRSYWWLEAPWLGILLATGIAALLVLALIELHRKNPIIDLRWLSSGDMLTFAGSLIIFRLLLSEQSVGAIGLFTALGMVNDQLAPLFLVIGIATLAGTVIVAMLIKPGSTPMLHLLALAMIAAGAWLDSQSTVLTRPEQFYVSQALMGLAAAIFLPPALGTGFAKALAGGPKYVLSFLTVFLTTQTFGGLLGSAVFQTFVTIREQFHSNVIAQGMTLLDPNVAQRVTAYGGAYARVLTDPAQRNAEGVVLLGQIATQQANVLAYNDMFSVIFVGALVAMAALLIHMLVDALNKPKLQIEAKAS
ncbi:MAG TPA: MFS transporter [Devosiaceae bacterium]|jgi:MFS family permease